MKIVCLGDSLTTGYNLAPGEGWVDLLNRETPHLWVNAGVAGDTSTGLLVRLQSQALPQKPDMVLFMGGDNDIMLTGSADQAKSAVMAMVHQCVAAGVRPVVGIPYPVRTIPAQWQPVCDMDRDLEASAEYVRWLRRLTDAISLRRGLRRRREHGGPVPARRHAPQPPGQPRHGGRRASRPPLGQIAQRRTSVFYHLSKCYPGLMFRVDTISRPVIEWT